MVYTKLMKLVFYGVHLSGGINEWSYAYAEPWHVFLVPQLQFAHPLNHIQNDHALIIRHVAFV